MKHNTRISTVSILCVLCICAANAAYGAASVRSLGGAGTYSGTTSASSSSAASSTGAARAGSVRVTPTSTKATTATSTTVSTGNTSAARGATTSRLSIGKYLSGGVKTDGSKLKPNISVTSPGNTNISNEVTQIVEALQVSVDKLQSDVLDLRDNMHPAPTGDGEFIYVDEATSEISINVSNLAKVLADEIEVDVGAIDIIKQGDEIRWCQSTANSECDYKTLFTLSDLLDDNGVFVSKDDLNNLEQKITTVIDGLNLGALAVMDTVGTEQINDGAVTEEKLSAELQEKINNGFADIDLSNYVTNDALKESLDGKQDVLTTDQMAVLDSGVTADAVAQIGLNAAAILTKADASDVYTKSETYSQTEIDAKISDVAGGVESAPDGGDYAWVSIGNSQQWVPIAGAVNKE